MDSQAAVRAWIDAWDKAWRAKDAAPLAAVYADDAVFRSHPFRATQSPLDYARGAFEEEGEELELWWGEPLVSGNRAAVEYWAVLRENDELVSLAGVATLHFGADGRVAEQHDYWASMPGRTPPWPDWAATSAR
jgi:ketosteroid isomerase-like protein